MKKTLLSIALFGAAFTATSQEIEANSLTKGERNHSTKPFNFSKEKAGTVGSCVDDTVRYPDNKSYYLDPNYYVGASRMSQTYRVFTTAYNVPTGGSVKVKGAAITAQVKRYNSVAQTSAALLSDTVVNGKVYIFNVDANNKPVLTNGKALDSTSIQIHAAKHEYYATFATPVTVTGSYAIGFRPYATAANDFVYISYNYMDISTATGNNVATNAAVVPYGEKLSYGYVQTGQSTFDFLDMATYYGQASFDFEFLMYPIVSHDFTVDFTNATPCSTHSNTLTNTSVNTEVFESATYSLLQFATKFNVPEGTASKQIRRDSIYTWVTSTGEFLQTNSKATPFTYTVSSSVGSHSDTLVAFNVTHDFHVCETKKVNTFTILNCTGLDEISAANFSVFPNPANDVVTVSLSDNNQNGTIVLTSADGKVIETRNYVNSLSQSFDVKGLTSGVYFFQVGNATEKVIIK